MIRFTTHEAADRLLDHLAPQMPHDVWHEKYLRPCIHDRISCGCTVFLDPEWRWDVPENRVVVDCRYFALEDIPTEDEFIKNATKTT